MAQNTVVLVGGAKLSAEVNVRALENAGFMVITANNLDYALAATELFKPSALVLGAEQTAGDIEFFCRTLASRPYCPALYVLSGSEDDGIGKALLAFCGKYLQKPSIDGSMRQIFVR